MLLYPVWPHMNLSTICGDHKENCHTVSLPQSISILCSYRCRIVPSALSGWCRTFSCQETRNHAVPIKLICILKIRLPRRSLGLFAFNSSRSRCLSIFRRAVQYSHDKNKVVCRVTAVYCKRLSWISCLAHMLMIAARRG